MYISYHIFEVFCETIFPVIPEEHKNNTYHPYYKHHQQKRNFVKHL